jgi:condensin-2 complex subunit G2
MEHASDTASVAVRVSALNTVTSLLEITSTRAVLRPLLPKLGNLVHDRVEKVRAACVRMLLRIKKIPGIKYYHVVPVDHLIARLAEEGRRNPKNSVASLITGLMLNSYIPQNLGGDEQISRTIKFLTTDPSAARVFYANICEYLSVNEVTKLAAMLLRCIHAQVETAKKSTKQNKMGKGSKRNRVQADDCNDEKNSMVLSLSLLADMAEVICVLLESVERDLVNNKECNDFLLKEFSGPMLTIILSHYENQTTLLLDNQESESLKDDCGRICTAILRCAGSLPAQTGDDLVSYIKLVLEAMTSHHASTLGENSKQFHVSGHIALLCLRGLTQEVALSMSASIESSFETDHELLFGSPCNDSKKRKSGKTRKSGRRSNGSTTTIPILPSTVALNVLGDILCASDPSCVAARELLVLSNEACHAIEKSLERGTRHAEKILSGDLVRYVMYWARSLHFIVCNFCS